MCEFYLKYCKLAIEDWDHNSNFHNNTLYDLNSMEYTLKMYYSYM